LYVEIPLFGKKYVLNEKKNDFMIAGIKLICIFVAMKNIPLRQQVYNRIYKMEN
jgi:hypothetical protein